MFKKLTIFMMAAIMAVSLCGCAGNEEKTERSGQKEETAVSSDSAKSEEPSNTSDFESVDVSSSGWKMSIDNVQIASELSNTSEVLGYSSASTNTFEQKAKDGNTYVLIKMTIKKEGAAENIQWKNMLLTDAEGNTYNRTDDSFIDSLSWKRISGTDLNFGSYEGWFAYEIPKDKTTSALVLSYKFSNEEMKYEIK